jgi:NAD(P)-dependent dehydrogenase (short-subunit alcohol dehydrogenase family)
MTVTLVTRANKTLGHVTARRPIQRGHTVYIGAQNVSRAEVARGLLSLSRADR